MFVNQIVCPVAVDLYNQSVNVDNARCNSKNWSLSQIHDSY